MWCRAAFLLLLCSLASYLPSTTSSSYLGHRLAHKASFIGCGILDYISSSQRYLKYASCTASSSTEAHEPRQDALELTSSTTRTNTHSTSLPKLTRSTSLCIMDRLPPELLDPISSFVDDTTGLSSLALTCRRMNTTARRHMTWRIYGSSQTSDFLDLLNSAEDPETRTTLRASDVLGLAFVAVQASQGEANGRMVSTSFTKLRQVLAACTELQRVSVGQLPSYKIQEACFGAIANLAHLKRLGSDSDAYELFRFLFAVPAVEQLDELSAAFHIDSLMDVPLALPRLRIKYLTLNLLCWTKTPSLYMPPSSSQPTASRSTSRSSASL